MTYNGYIILAVVVGAFLGHLAFHGSVSSLCVTRSLPPALQSCLT